MKKKIIVAGAGASGLLAAVSAARSGAEVTVLEAQERPGRKLLVTGNGRCNLTFAAGNFTGQYHGTGAHLAEELLAQFSVNDTLKLFSELGLLTRQKGDCIYPYTSQASSVLEVLLAELRRLRVKLKFSVHITKIIDHGDCKASAKKNSDDPAIPDTESALRQHPSTRPAPSPRFSVVTPAWTYTADAVILACGSKASPSTGASESGYTLAQSLGHSILSPRPVLVPFTCPASFPEQRLAGVRCRARVSLLRSAHIKASGHAAKPASFDLNAKSPQIKYGNHVFEQIAQDTGELQWTNYGISGIVIFQLSRFAQFPANCENRSRQTSTQQMLNRKSSRRSQYLICIDFLPDYTEHEIMEILLQRAGALGSEPVSVLLRGMLHEKLIPIVLKRAAELCSNYSPGSCSDLLEQKEFLSQLVTVIKGYLLPVAGTKSFDQAQVCAGGVDCREITARLESGFHKGLYFAGELLDVDGPCGGYNLQWAWTSGYLAGKNAAEEPNIF